MDPYIALARLAVAHFVTHRKPLSEVPISLRQALAGVRAGVFVSLHSIRDHDLRGCIGTLGPTRETVEQEIIGNAIAACSRDARFNPVRPDELEDLDIRVDVLGEPTPVQARTELDPRRFGVIVSTRDGRRGVLLPDLEGVDSVAQQLSIACRKAHIDETRDAYAIEKFTVNRHMSD